MRTLKKIFSIFPLHHSLYHSVTFQGDVPVKIMAQARGHSGAEGDWSQETRYELRIMKDEILATGDAEKRFKRSHRSQKPYFGDQLHFSKTEP